MLEDVYKSYRRLADEIDWKKYNQNELVFEYIKHENDELRDNFFAGIVCRYWGYSGRIWRKTSYHVTFEECYDCVIDAIKYVLSKRVWENKDNSLYGDKAGPDKAIHIALKRQMSIMLSKKNAYRRLSNFNTMSLDGAHEDYNDATEGLFISQDSFESNDKVSKLISSYFDGDDYLNGLLLDAICFSPSDEVYDEKKVIKSVKELNRHTFEYYRDKYSANEDIYRRTVNNITQMSNQLLEVKLRSLLYELRRGELLND